MWPEAADRAEIDPFLLEGPRLFTDKRNGKTRGAESQRGGVEGRGGVGEGLCGAIQVSGDRCSVGLSGGRERATRASVPPPVSWKIP